MAVRLTVKQRSEAGGAAKGAEVLLDDDVINLGRDKTCQVVLAQMAVSRTHARITRDGTLFFVEDLGSAYGTLVNGKPLPKGEKRLLRNGDTIVIAQFDITFDRIADAPRESADKTSFIARHVVKDVMRGLGSQEGPYFRVMNGPREGQRIEISDAQELIVGREEGVDVVLHDDLISRRHAKIRRDWSGTHVEDLGSRNGIKVNKKRVARKTIKDRDEVEIGGIRLLYLDPAEVREAPVVLPQAEDEEELTSAPDPDPQPSEEVEAPQSAEAPSGEAEQEEQPDEAPPEEAQQPAYDGSFSDDGGGQDEEPSPEEDPPPEEDYGADDPEEQEPPPGKDDRYGNVTIVFSDVRKTVTVALMGVFALLALVLIIALFAGA